VLQGHPTIRAIWVPPFPDESGCAIGAAAAHAGRAGLRAIDWDIRRGPALRRHVHVPVGWSIAPCRPEELARMMHHTGEPVAVLHGRAKLGPRALCARSILVPAIDRHTGDRVNRAVGLSADRPLAALCLAGRSAEVFVPGTPDPYRLYQHRIRPEWVDRLPVVRSTDARAQLQTVDPDDATLTAILREYDKWSGVPVLAYADAGPGGRGLFQDAVAAMHSAGIDTVWSDSVLYRRVRSSAA
jgi:carbamoyltransferase